MAKNPKVAVINLPDPINLLSFVAFFVAGYYGKPKQLGKLVANFMVTTSGKKPMATVAILYDWKRNCGPLAHTKLNKYQSGVLSKVGNLADATWEQIRINCLVEDVSMPYVASNSLFFDN